jgi:hypothetical protein
VGAICEMGETGDAGSVLYPTPVEEFVLSARPLELLPLWSTCRIAGLKSDCEAASAAGLMPVGLWGTGFRLMVAARGISSTIGILGRRFLCSGVVCRPRTGDSALSSGSVTSATECRLE